VWTDCTVMMLYDRLLLGTVVAVGMKGRREDELGLFWAGLAGVDEGNYTGCLVLC
jgi:hypothetical protein